MRLSSMCLGMLLVLVSGLVRGGETSRPRQLVLHARIYESTETDVGRVKSGTLKVVGKPRVIVDEGQRAEFHIGDELRSDRNTRDADSVRFLETGKFLRTRAKILDSGKLKLDVDLTDARNTGAVGEQKRTDSEGKRYVTLGAGECAAFYLGPNRRGVNVWIELSARVTTDSPAK